MRVDHFPAGAGQVVTCVRHFDIARHRPVPSLHSQISEELVRVGQVLEPMPARHQVELG